MPLFFLIAIGAGALTMGAATADVTGSANANHSARAQAAQTTSFQASAYSDPADCLSAAAAQGLPASVCQRS
jgi:hypothetical protein